MCFRISVLLRVFIAFLLTGNYEWDSNVAQLKDVEFILTSVAWNKFQISLCRPILFFVAKLFLHIVQYIITL